MNEANVKRKRGMLCLIVLSINRMYIDYDSNK